jgi:hypothetical protein
VVLNLYAVPPFLLLVVALIVAPLAACAGQWYVHRAFRGQRIFANNDVAGFIISVVGTIYAVVLGFITVVVWQQFDSSRVNVALESASVGDVWHNAVGLPPAVRTRVRADMLDYARTMVNQEWPLMRLGSFSPRGDQLIMDATTVVGSMIPANLAQSNAQTSILRLLDELHDNRANRLASNTTAVSAFQWLVLWIGAGVVLGFCYLFSVSHIKTHLMMTGAVAVIVAAMFVLLFELQAPFRSQLGIAPDAWQALIAHIEFMDRGPAPMRMQ